jgi:hypothetical protein
VARRFSSVPSALTTRISGLLSPEEKAIVVPVGDQTGSEAGGAFFADNLRLPCPSTPTMKMALPSLVVINGSLFPALAYTILLLSRDQAREEA